MTLFGAMVPQRADLIKNIARRALQNRYAFPAGFAGLIHRKGELESIVDRMTRARESDASTSMQSQRLGCKPVNGTDKGS
jgi:hypothetical protein